jgi:diacylglycerol kinase (ATP)
VTVEPAAHSTGDPDRRVVVIRNPVAGRWRERRFRAALAGLAAAGCRVDLRETTAPGDATRLAAEAAAEADVVVAAGGDGTINEALNGLAAPDTAGGAALGVIPLGTANVFAAEIGLDDSIDRAVAAIARGPLRPICLGVVGAGEGAEAGRRLFGLMLGVGFDARVVAAVTPRLKRRLGKAAYVLHSLIRLVCYRDATFTVTVDGVDHRAASAIVANGRFYAGRYVSAPDARLDRDSFEVCLFTRGGRWNVLRYGAALLFGRLARLPDFEIVTGRSLTIDGPAGDPVQADGDIVARLPLSVSVLDRRIAVAMPPDPAP